MPRITESWIRFKNIEHYRRLLEITGDENERAVIVELLAEEVRKYKDAGDRREEE